MRIFIGIPFSEDTRRRIQKGVLAVQPTLSKGKFTHWDGYHLTLKFLGEVSEEGMGHLAQRIARTQLHTEAFSLRFTALGVFSKRGGDVLWLGAAESSPLQALQREVEALCCLEGFAPENRHFTPHLTLARGVRYTEGFEQAAARWPQGEIRQQVTAIALFQSTQVNGRVAYIPLTTKKLAPSPDGLNPHNKEDTMSTRKPEIVFGETGPYTAVDIEDMEYLKGEKVPVKRVMLLCRCGESAKKPFCDGSHEKVDFNVPQRSQRGKNRYKDYVGKNITIRFSLRVCSHAGVCYTKLPTVFDRAKKPWINPDGAEVQEIIDIINRCPSGALSYSEATDAVADRCRPAKIVIIKDGPFNVQGNIRIRDEAGTEPYDPDRYCLCRCGKSRNAPFCDGTHLPPDKRAFFKEDQGPDDPE